jgi:alkylation response protein AidB-like acyl-CoA dehydrogenase
MSTSAERLEMAEALNEPCARCVTPEYVRRCDEREVAAIEDGRSGEVESAVAKVYASEAYASAAREGIQVFGGHGYTEEYPMARHYRDSKFMELAGGTSEIQKVIIARSLGIA